MNRRRVLTAATALATTAIVSIGGAAHADGSPTCAETLGIDVHGQHVVRDYVLGGTDDETWPYSEGIGRQIGEQGGAALPGGPGPAFHFANGFAPGASFCTGSNSPGDHL